MTTATKRTEKVAQTTTTPAISLGKFDHDADTVYDAIGVTKDQLDSLHARAEAVESACDGCKSKSIEAFARDFTKDVLAIIAGAHFDSGMGGLAEMLVAMHGGIGEDDEDESPDGE